MKKILREIFIDGLGGMATGLFATLIIGTIIVQISTLIPGSIGSYIFLGGKLAMALTGAGIGVGVASKLKSSPLVLVSAIASGMIGAYASKIVAAVNAGDIAPFFADNTTHLVSVGEPLGAFLAVITTIYIGKLVSGKTPVDILITPLCCIASGSAVGLVLGPPISGFMTWLGTLINWGTEQAPFLMGVVVSVLMGVILTLPISSAALGVILGLGGLAAGAATVGCCANMIGFAVASYKENKVNGLLAQGLGTSMLQIGNIVKKPIIWLPAIISSAILGPVSTMVFKMTNNATGSGMGTAGLVGPINTYQTMVSEGASGSVVLIKIIVIQFILPAALSLVISNFMRRKGFIKDGDMKLKV
ncbi:MAG: PTS sugar transporter subunit IIC [Lachnospiraceae bacterium]|nr:PTS sugar transporter subunit IIC [Lachnospiraceae bacterium]